MTRETGPWPGIDAHRGPEPVTVPLDTPVGGRGAVMLWVRLEQPIVNGPGVEAENETILELTGLAKLNIWWNAAYAGIDWKTEAGPDISVEVPGLPGPQWLHLCYTWDAAAGRSQGYINGTPVTIPGTQADSWDAPDVAEITVHASRWAVADLVVADRCLRRADVLDAVPGIYRGALDALLGAKELGPLQPDQWRGYLLFEYALAKPDEVDGWRMEGTGAVEFHDGWMRMKSTSPDAPPGHGHLVHWCDRDVPADFLLEFEVRILTDDGLNIIFFCAKGRDGRDLLDPSLDKRSGVFNQYTIGDIDCYHTSYFAGSGRTTTNLRKNHGFQLVATGPVGIRAGDRAVHRVALLKTGGDIRLGVDGCCILDWHDAGDHYGPVLGNGKIGLRQMKPTVAEYRNLRVSQIIRKSAAENV